MQEKKIKLLMLGTFDKKAGGHIYDTYNHLPPEYEAVMVTRASSEGSEAHSFTKSGSWGDFILRRFAKFAGIVNVFFKTGQIYSIKKAAKHKEFCFYDNDYISYSAKSILSKCPKGFVPDYISVHWSAEFVSSKLLYDLHKMTGAKIVTVMIDQAPVSGGCHFAVNCSQYMTGCTDCPAYKSKIPSLQWSRKNKYLADLPKIVVGVPSDLRMAQKTPFLSNALFIPMIINPNVRLYDKAISRKELGLPDARFYLFCGADSLRDKRKGFKYVIEAAKLASKRIPNFTLLVAGKNVFELEPLLDGIDYKFLGFLDLQSLLKAFASSDCFISTSLADSGPVMVNYSIAEGTPVVSFNVGIAQDLVVHKKTGYIAEYADPSSLSNGIVYIDSLTDNEKKQMHDDCILRLQELSENGSWPEQLLRSAN